MDRFLVATVAVAGLAVALAAVDPAPLVLATAIFLAMCAQWVFAVSRWLATGTGEPR